MVKQVPTNSLKLRDIVRTSDAFAYSFATVIEISDDVITICRPYVHTSDFEHGDKRVIPYVGTETFYIFASDTMIDKWE